MERFDRAQAEYLVQTYADLILRLSYTYLRSTQDAEDICQTVFLKYLTAAPPFESPAHERAWILKTAANACKDVLRSAWRTRTCGLEACGEAAAPPMPEDHGVLAAVQALPELYRVPLYLHYYEGYTFREIAEILNIRPATVNSRIDRGRRRLRKSLGGEYGEQGT